MTTIKELFEAQGTPIEAKDVREGDIISTLWGGGNWSVNTVSAEWHPTWIADAYRLLHRPAPVLPTTPGSILGTGTDLPRAVLAPRIGWYGVIVGGFLDAEKLHEGLANGTYTILLDTGATK